MDHFVTPSDIVSRIIMGIYMQTFNRILSGVFWNASIVAAYVSAEKKLSRFYFDFHKKTLQCILVHPLCNVNLTIFLMEML